LTITARSSVVKCSPGVYQLATVLKAIPIKHKKPYTRHAPYRPRPRRKVYTKEERHAYYLQRREYILALYKLRAMYPSEDMELLNRPEVNIMDSK